MKKNIPPLLLLVFVLGLLPSMAQQENERPKDFCQILEEFCIKTEEFEDVYEGLITYHLDAEQLSKDESINPEALMNLYKEAILSPDDTFYFYQEKSRFKRQTKSYYGFRRLYKGLQVKSDQTFFMLNEKGIPYLFRTNAQLIKVDTTSIISVKQAVDNIRNEYVQLELRVPESFSQEPIKYPVQKIEKLISFIENQPKVVYRIRLIDYRSKAKIYLAKAFYVNIKTGKIEFIEDLSAD